MKVHIGQGSGLIKKLNHNMYIDQSQQVLFVQVMPWPCDMTSSMIPSPSIFNI